jgi:hypothetical protein
MKRLLILILLVMCALSQSFLGFSRTPPMIYPIYDSLEVEIPRNLRTALLARGKQSHLNLDGLNHLRISGSAQFSEITFKTILKHLDIQPKKLIVLDLRQESHGFINGHPISWTDGVHNYANVDKTKFEIESDEYQRLRLAVQAKQIVINPLEEPTKLTVCRVKTERDLVESYGATYVRLPVTDHNRPSNEVIDQFIELVRSLPSDHWIHMHCKAGKGRTTMFLTLFDIIQNAQHVSLKDILARQHSIGGIDLTQIHKKNNERTRAAHERLEFIREFYRYCQHEPDFKVSWSNWSKQQRLVALVQNPS